MADYRIPKNLADFSRRGVERFEGMLNKGAAVTAALTTTIIERELSWNTRAFLEIGVFKGKFFALMAKATEGTNARLVGIDPFDQPEQTRLSVLQSLASENLDLSRTTLVEGYSSEKDKIREALGDASLTLCHVDGSHVAEDVYQDLLLVNDIVAENGVVIADDFWNKSQLGVTTAIFRMVLENSTDLKPFMISNTKLYLSRAAETEVWKQRFIEGFEQNQEFTLFADWIKKRKTRPAWHTEQLLADWPILLV